MRLGFLALLEKLSQIQDLDSKDTDLASTKSGLPLSRTQSVVLEVTRRVFYPFYRFFAPVENAQGLLKYAKSRLSRANLNVPLSGMLLNYSIDAGHLRAGPKAFQWLFNILNINAFNFKGWIILNPALLNQRARIIPVIIHEIGALFGLPHELNIKLEGIYYNDNPENVLTINRYIIEELVLKARLGFASDSASVKQPSNKRLSFTATPNMPKRLVIAGKVLYYYMPSHDDGWAYSYPIRYTSTNMESDIHDFAYDYEEVSNAIQGAKEHLLNSSDTNNEIASRLAGDFNSLELDSDIRDEQIEAAFNKLQNYFSEAYESVLNGARETVLLLWRYSVHL
jgi:hypothetical protein